LIFSPVADMVDKVLFCLYSRTYVV